MGGFCSGVLGWAGLVQVTKGKAWREGGFCGSFVGGG